LAGETNCGINDRKKSAVFGLRTSVAMPCKRFVENSVLQFAYSHLHAVSESSKSPDRQGRPLRRSGRLGTRWPRSSRSRRVPILQPRRGLSPRQRSRGRIGRLHVFRRGEFFPKRKECPGRESAQVSSPHSQKARSVFRRSLCSSHEVYLC
jgi:hypothetical protein